MSSKPSRRERGAVAVEFALVAPLFLTVLLGIVEYGNFFRVQISVTQAAREAARAMAVADPTASAATQQASAQAAAAAASPTINSSAFQYTFSSPACSSGQTMTVTIKYSLSSLTGTMGPWTVTGISAMRCGG